MPSFSAICDRESLVDRARDSLNRSATLPAGVLAEIDGPLCWLANDLLCMISAAAELSFDRYRLEHESAASAFGVDSENETAGLADAFSQELRLAKLAPLYEAYPELEGLLAMREAFFLETVAELGARLDTLPGLSHRAEIRRIRFGWSDSHCRGRTVAKVELDNGRAVFYKPRPVEMESAYHTFLDWFNAQNHGLPRLKAAAVTDCGSYGWMDEACQEPVEESTDRRLYFLRAGMHLGLVDLFGGVDIHAENLVSCGLHPVLVDMETLFHPPSPFEKDADPLVRTEFLPRPLPANQSDGYVLCALGVLPGTQLPEASEVIDGFTRVHRFFQRSREKGIWRNDGPVARAFAGKRTRRIRRATRIYNRLLRFAVEPEKLRGLRLDDEEIRALCVADIPYFGGVVDKETLAWARQRAEAIDDRSLDTRIATIRGALSNNGRKEGQ